MQIFPYIWTSLSRFYIHFNDSEFSLAVKNYFCYGKERILLHKGSFQNRTQHSGIVRFVDCCASKNVCFIIKYSRNLTIKKSHYILEYFFLKIINNITQGFTLFNLVKYICELEIFQNLRN